MAFRKDVRKLNEQAILDVATGTLGRSQPFPFGATTNRPKLAFPQETSLVGTPYSPR